MTPDNELLQRYAKQGDEAAFAEVVRRHVNLVYASAVRLLNGDATQAQDVTQAVFTDLARKAAIFGNFTTVAGWLHTNARYVALNAIRTEQRRRIREKEASIMSESTTIPEISWNQLRPLIDEAIGQLPAEDRDVVLLRFFEEKSHREIGENLGLNENTARMRVERAVEKLRVFFARHGVTTSAALLTSTLSAHPTTTAPIQFASVVAVNSVAGAHSAAGGKLAGVFASKTNSILASMVIVAAAASTVLIIHSRKNLPPLEKNVPANSTPATSLAKPSSASTTAANPTPIVGVGALATTLASAVATTTVAATSADSLPADNPAATSDSSPATNQNPPISAQEPAPPVKTDNPPIGATRTGLATWSNGHSPVLVDMTGILKDKTITAIASSGGSNPHFLALCSDGTLAAWGDNSEGQLGIGKAGRSSFSKVPALVNTSGELAGETVTAIAAYGNYSMALTSDGNAYVWGSDDKGGILDNNQTPTYCTTSFAKTTPMRVPGFTAKQVVAIAAGSSPLSFCSDGSLYMWGYWTNGNHSAQFGISGPLEHLASSVYDHDVIQLDHAPHGFWPAGALKNKTIAAISSGSVHGLALCTDGTLVFWGCLYYPNPQATLTSNKPFALHTSDIFKGKTINAIGDGGGNRLMALCADGTLAIWQEKPLIAGPQINSPPPALGEYIVNPDDGRSYCVAPIIVNSLDGVLKGKNITAIGSSKDSMVMLCSDGTLAQWDLNGKLEAIDTSGVLKDKKILSIAPGVVLFSEEVDADQTDQTGSVDTSPSSATPPGKSSPTQPTPAFKPFGIPD